MTVATPAVTQDAHILENQVDENVGRKPFLIVGGVAAQNRRAFLFAPRKFPLGSTIVDGKLRLYTRDIWSGGPITVTARLITSRWREEGATAVTWADQPNVSSQTATANVANNAPADTLVEIDVTALLQLVSDGTAYHGFRLSIATATSHRFH